MPSRLTQSVVRIFPFPLAHVAVVLGSVLVFGLLCGVPMPVLLRFQFSLIVQGILGVALLETLRVQTKSEHLRVGLAMAIGSITIGALVLLRGEVSILQKWSTPVEILTLALVAGLQIWRRRSSINSERPTTASEFSWVSVCQVAGASLLLNQAWPWLLGWTIAMIATAFGLSRIGDRAPRAAIAVVSVTVPIFAYVSRFWRIDQWWGFRASGMPDPDIQFLESSMNSVGLFGFSNTIFFDGFRYTYHVFSFAWLNGLSEMTSAPPFQVSAILGPITVAVLLMQLIFGFIIERGGSQLDGVLGCFAVAVLWVGSVPLVGAWSPYSFSHNYSLLILTCLVAIVVPSGRRQSLLLIGVFSIAATLSKASLLPIVLVVVSAAWLLGGNKSPRRISFAGFAVVFATTVGVFVWHFRPLQVVSGGEVHTPKLGVGGLLAGKGFGPPDENLATRVILVVVFLALLLALSLANRPRGDTRDKGVPWRKLSPETAGGVAAVLAGCLLIDGAESISYVMASGVLLLQLPSFLSMTRTVGLISDDRKLIVLLSLFSAVTLVAAREVWSVNSLPFVTSLALVLAVVSAGVFTRTQLAPRYKMRALSLVIVIAFGTLSLATAVRSFSEISFWKRWVWQPYELPGGDPATRELLHWIRANSPEDAMVVGTRHCNYGYQRFNSGEPAYFNFGANCNQIYSLTSALTARVQYFEGHYPLLPPVPLEERNRRIAIADAFIGAPSRESAEVLWADGVDFVIVENITTGISELASSFGIVFRNDAGYIIDMALSVQGFRGE